MTLTQSQLAAIDPDLLVVPKLRYYSAGFIPEASLWRAFAKQTAVHDIINVASWIALPDTEPAEPYYAGAWLLTLAEIESADALLIGTLCPPAWPLRGALVEAGAALALGKRVLLLGKHESFGNWQHHPLCLRVATLDEALSVMIAVTEALEVP
jgi:hypothetical protein